MNKLFPGTIARYNGAGIALAERENLQLFINACLQVGVPSHETFSQSDLYDKKFLPAVLTTLHALSRTAQSNGWSGDILGIRIQSSGYGVQKNPRWSIASNTNYRRGRQ
jgi:hypothetical protein